VGAQGTKLVLTELDPHALGFRCIPAEFPRIKEITSVAGSHFGYEILKAGATSWLRLPGRRRGVASNRAIVLGPAIRREDIDATETYEFLNTYRKTGYAEEQRKIQFTRQSLQKGVERAAGEVEAFRRFHGLTQTLAFSNPLQLRSLLQDQVLPAFFRLDPDGVVQVLALGDKVEHSFAFLRATYTLSHYPVVEIDRSRGFAALSEWDRALPIDYVEACLSILQTTTYPYIPMFHGGPFGLTFVFLLSKPELVHLPVFPRSWMQWTRSGSEFGLESLDGVAAITHPESELGRRGAHRRYLSTAPMLQAAFHELLLWVASRLDILLQELPDPANFEHRGNIDFVFALEHNLSLVRLFRRAIHILGSEEPPSGKFMLFEIADLLQELTTAFKGKAAGEAFFKQLFNPTGGREVCRRCLKNLPKAVQPFFFEMIERVYSELEIAVAESIWIKGKVKGGRVSVRSTDLSREVEEGLGEFIGNLFRVFRNTHHGYFSRLDPRKRPSRYLAMTTGNIPDSVSCLALVWCLCVLADTSTMPGWKPLGFGIY